MIECVHGDVDPSPRGAVGVIVGIEAPAIDWPGEVRDAAKRIIRS